jgi:hypothetical protein
MKKPITSIFVPKAVDENPYQNLLDQQLRKIDVHVSRAGYGVLFLPTVFAKWKPDIVHLHWLHPYV